MTVAMNPVLTASMMKAMGGRDLYPTLLDHWLEDMAGKVETEFFAVQIGDRLSQLSVNCFAMVPPEPQRVVFVHAGAGHCFAEDCTWISKMLRAGSAVIDIEPYGHGPYSSPFPELGHTRDLTTAYLQVADQGLISYFARNSQLTELPFHELGHSMGGGTIVDAHMQGPVRINLGSGETKEIESMTLLGPRLQTKYKRYRILKRTLVPLMKVVNVATGGGLELLRQKVGLLGVWKSVVPKRYGVTRESREGQWMIETSKAKLRPRSLPWPYALTCFDHDEAIQQRIHAHNFDSLQPRVLWGLAPDDYEIESPVVAELAMQLSSDAMLMRIGLHNPFWDDDSAQVISAIHAFMDGETHERLLDLNHENITQVLG